MGGAAVTAGPTFSVLEENVPDAAAGASVHPAGGLVQDHGARRAQEGDADGQPPPEAPGEGVGLCVLVRPQPHVPEGPEMGAGPELCPSLRAAPRSPREDGHGSDRGLCGPELDRGPAATERSPEPRASSGSEPIRARWPLGPRAAGPAKRCPGKPPSCLEEPPRRPPAPSTRQDRSVAPGTWAVKRRQPRGHGARQGPHRSPVGHLPDQGAGRSGKQLDAPPDAINVQTRPFLPETHLHAPHFRRPAEHSEWPAAPPPPWPHPPEPPTP